MEKTNNKPMQDIIDEFDELVSISNSGDPSKYKTLRLRLIELNLKMLNNEYLMFVCTFDKRAEKKDFGAWVGHTYIHIITNMSIRKDLSCSVPRTIQQEQDAQFELYNLKKLIQNDKDILAKALRFEEKERDHCISKN